MEAVWIVPPVAMSVLFQTMYTFFGNIEFYYEKTKLVMTASLIVAILNIILNAIFIPIFGFAAAGYTTLICYVFYSIVHYLFMLQICRKEHVPRIYNGRILWGTSVIYILMSILAAILYRYQVLRYILIIFFGIVSGVILWIKRRLIKDIFHK